MVSSLSLGTISNSAEASSMRTVLSISNRGVDERPAVKFASNDPSDSFNVPTFSKIEQLRGTDPAEFQQELADVISRLKAAAEQSPNPFVSGYLWSLINQFQFALDANRGVADSSN
jgi:hypothetical protein